MLTNMYTIRIECYFGNILEETNLGTIPSTDTSKTGCFKTFVTKRHNAGWVSASALLTNASVISSQTFGVWIFLISRHAEGSLPQISPTRHPETIRLLIYDAIGNNNMSELFQNFLTIPRISSSFLFRKTATPTWRSLYRITSTHSFWDQILGRHTYEIHNIGSQ